MDACTNGLHVLTTDLLVVVIQYYKSLGKIWGSFCEGIETKNIQKSIHWAGLWTLIAKYVSWRQSVNKPYLAQLYLSVFHATSAILIQVYILLNIYNKRFWYLGT